MVRDYKEVVYLLEKCEVELKSYVVTEMIKIIKREKISIVKIIIYYKQNKCIDMREELIEFLLMLEQISKEILIPLHNFI
jgi:hypothetical protein